MEFAEENLEEVNMSKINYVDKNGTFELKNPEHTSGLYLPMASKKGLKSAVTPDFGGDAKTDQNHFMIAPKSILNLSNDRDTRNFFLVMDGKLWSVTGVSAEQEANRFTDKEDSAKLTAGRMWQRVERNHSLGRLKSTTTIFDTLDHNAEIMLVTIENLSDEDLFFEPVAAIPLYGRSADNLRDHRHVTSLLNRAVITDDGVVMHPTLSFDERGHQKNDMSYFVFGRDENGNKPNRFIADVEDYLGAGGTFLRPRSLLDKKGKDTIWKKPTEAIDGKEIVAVLRFPKCNLKKSESCSFQIVTGMVDNENIAEMDIIRRLIYSKTQVENLFETTKNYWNSVADIIFETGNERFDGFMKWVSFQPELRRIFGCSFLPHHDYGRGGRGWRDLWQDCLALLLTDPTQVRDMLVNNFKGVRLDGTNATIIGDKKGEFKADRNGIPRVWMDHGFWPFLTVKLYMDQTGDLDILNEKVSYFKDALINRVTKRDEEYFKEYGLEQKNAKGEVYKGTILEHILLENLCAFYDVGAHNEIRLLNADWNDALDMAPDKGESVAFTCGYAGNLKELATYLRIYKAKTGRSKVSILKELLILLEEDSILVYGNPAKRRKVLEKYVQAVSGEIPGETVLVEIEKISVLLEHKADFMMKQIREEEWVTDKEGNGWFNGYYDNNGARVEGAFENGVRMMLTGQVLSIMSGTAKKESVVSIVKSCDKYLYKKGLGGYALNTDFKDLRLDLGRMFGFAYGEKENGAVFSHMAVMYANALYKRGFVKEGYKAINELFMASDNFDISNIYPGVPEYFNEKGKGLYSYLTGAASWYLLTMVTEVFGVRGNAGDLYIEPKLLKEQFNEEGIAAIQVPFRGHRFKVVFKNTKHKDYGEYSISNVIIDSTSKVKPQKNQVIIPEKLLIDWNEKDHIVEIELK